MDRREDRRLHEALVDRAARGKWCALATIVETKGSTPRKAGTKMLVEDGGALVGTVGGGCGEGEVLEAAREVIRTRTPRVLRIDLTEDLLSWSPAVCGGTMDIFVEPVPPTASTVDIHYLRPPDREEVFRQALLYDSPEGKVTLAAEVSLDRPVVIDGEIALESGASAVWVTFPGLWHDIGRFHRADGTFTGYYANILTPPEFLDGGVWKTTDLFLDVWLTPDGESSVLDEDQLEEAVRRSWVDADTAARAREEVETIVRAIGEERWPPPIAREWTLERAVSAAGYVSSVTRQAEQSRSTST